MTLVQQAQAALAHWRGSGKPRLISHRENAVFEGRIGDQRAALRLHRPGYRTAAEIASELSWSTALARAGLPVPQAIPDPHGALVWTPPEGCCVSVTTWIDGQPMGAADRPLGPDALPLHRDLGALLARLHLLSDAWTPPPGFSRPPWDRAALTGPDPAWGHYWTHPDLDAGARALIETARDKADAVLRAQAFDQGLIHADALRENVFRTDTGLTLIDFDDSGVGYRLYDLAGALSQSLDSPDLSLRAQALVQGYTGLRPLPEAAHLPMFSMLRAFSSLGWVIPRAEAGSAKQRLYLDRACRAARAFVEGPPLFTL